jgi:hypothetical protein
MVDGELRHWVKLSCHNLSNNAGYLSPESKSDLSSPSNNTTNCWVPTYSFPLHHHQLITISRASLQLAFVHNLSLSVSVPLWLALETLKVLVHHLADLPRRRVGLGVVPRHAAAAEEGVQSAADVLVCLFELFESRDKGRDCRRGL